MIVEETSRKQDRREEQVKNRKKVSRREWERSIETIREKKSREGMRKNLRDEKRNKANK